jgi:hypothetical protein
MHACLKEVNLVVPFKSLFVQSLHEKEMAACTSFSADVF